MKAIIASILTAAIAVVSFAAPAGATFGTTSTGNNNGDGFYISGNSGFSVSGWSKMGIKDGKFYIEGETVMCHKMNSVMGGQMTTGDAKVNKPTPNLPSADTNGCATGDVENTVNNPPANSTVTISGVCDAIAAKLKANITGNNVTVIINSTGACKDDQGTPVATTPVTVNVTQNNPEPVKQASATTPTAANSNPKGGSGATAELPQTGASEVITAVVATILAGSAYAGTMAVRAFRARA